MTGLGTSHAAYPPDPPGNGPDWDGFSGGCGFSSASDIACAFNAARQWEANLIGIALTSMAMPSQAEWDTMNDSEKALHLINQERLARGVMQLSGVEENVVSIAQQYADFMLQEYFFDHYCPVSGGYCEGMSPWQRLNANAAINACHDFLSVAENLAVFVTSGFGIAMPVERSE